MSRLQALGQRFGLANPKVVSNLTFNFYLFFVFVVGYTFNYFS